MPGRPLAVSQSRLLSVDKQMVPLAIAAAAAALVGGAEIAYLSSQRAALLVVTIAAVICFTTILGRIERGQQSSVGRRTSTTW